MIDLTKLPSLIQRSAQEKNYPKHVIINLFPIKYSEDKKKEEFTKLLTIFSDLIDLQKEKNIPILTVSLGKKVDLVEQLLYDFCKELHKKANENKINVTLFGRYYDLMGQLVDKLNRIKQETDDFDHFFLNICINYDSKQEIADAARVIIRKVQEQQQDVDSITPEVMKENVYSSFLIPPDLIIEPSLKFQGTFLWDSAGAQIIQLNKPVLDITKQDVLRAFEKYAQKA